MSQNQPLAGQTIIITGASDGIGAVAARELSRMGATIAVVGRSPEKTRRVAEAAKAEAFICDFAELSQVKNLAHKLLERYPRIDVLVNNAGLIWNLRSLTQDGHEVTFQVNHLAPFLLTQLLHPRLAKNKARIINTSSIGNLMGKVNLNDLEFEKGYTAMKAYTTSKLENILFTKEIARRWSAEGIRTASFHPGPVATQFGNSASASVRLLYHTPLKNLFLISAEKGADTLIWLASTTPDKDWKNGVYYVKRKAGRFNPSSNDEALAKGLWEKSMEMVKPFLN